MPRALYAFEEERIQHADGLVDRISYERVAATPKPGNLFAPLRFGKHGNSMFFENANDTSP